MPKEKKYAAELLAALVRFLEMHEAALNPVPVCLQDEIQPNKKKTACECGCCAEGRAVLIKVCAGTE